MDRGVIEFEVNGQILNRIHLFKFDHSVRYRALELSQLRLFRNYRYISSSCIFVQLSSELIHRHNHVHLHSPRCTPLGDLPMRDRRQVKRLQLSMQQVSGQVFNQSHVFQGLSRQIPPPGVRTGLIGLATLLVCFCFGYDLIQEL